MGLKLKQLLRANFQQILFVFLAFAAMVLVSSLYVSDIMSRQMQVLGNEIMNTVQAAVSSGLSEVELMFSSLAQTSESLLSAGKTNEELLDYLKETNRYFSAEHSPLPSFMKVYGYVRGEYVDGSGWIPPEGYAPSARPWYIGAVRSYGRIFFSEPYLDAETGGVCISFSKELIDRGGLSYGILAIDLKLTRITDYVAGHTIAWNGYGVLLSDAMNFIVHRDPALIGTKIAQAGDGYARLEGLLAEGSDISAERFTDTDGTDSVAFFRPVFKGWHLGVIIPRSSYYAQVYQLNLVLGSLGFVLMLALSYILVRTHAAKIRSDEESRSKSNFLARMSHEMRTPMNAIIGMTSIAQKSGDMGKVRECLGKIDAAANHLLGIINDVLDMSKIEAGKLELAEIEFSFQDLLHQVVTVSGFKMEGKSQVFTVAIDDAVPAYMVSDQQRLAQVLTNLLSNASKFTPDGGEIRLSVHSLHEADGACVLQFEIADSGIGISAQQQEKLFRSFEQADGSISRKYGGTGLGLAISKTIVEAMGGTIGVESELGQGARFFFTVNAAVGSGVHSPESVALPVAGDPGRSFSGKRILLAEDVEINREILISLLEGTGIIVECAETGRRAVELFSSAPEAYDLIFMDIHMPEMDGYEATRRIRALKHPHASAVPIIAMTANVFLEDIERCLSAGMNNHVGKPLALTAIMDMLGRYL